MIIPFNKPYLTGSELEYIFKAHENGQLAGDGEFTKRCNIWLERQLGVRKALLTHSCTAALEMAAILLDIKPGDEVIMPSYTFVSTANAFVLRGATPVFVDIRADTLNIDENLIESAITKKTKAIVPVHYAGVGCEMDTIMEIAKSYKLVVIEDAAQGIKSKYKGKFLGSIGDLGCLSFHETKNIISGEGGALLINNPEYIERAEVIREKGTDRTKFLRGMTDKYTWKDIGSSYLPGEIIAAFLWAQLEMSDEITCRRIAIWDKYDANINSFEQKLFKPSIPKSCEKNAHLYPLIFNDTCQRDNFIDSIKAEGIHCVSHYIPLHNSDYGLAHSISKGNLEITQWAANGLVRLPIWLGLEDKQNLIIEKINATLRRSF